MYIRKHNYWDFETGIKEKYAVSLNFHYFIQL